MEAVHPRAAGALAEAQQQAAQGQCRSRLPAEAAAGRGSCTAQFHGRPCRRLPRRPQILSIIVLSLAPVWLWSIVVAVALGLYATYAEVTSSTALRHPTNAGLGFCISLWQRWRQQRHAACSRASTLVCSGSPLAVPSPAVERQPPSPHPLPGSPMAPPSCPPTPTWWSPSSSPPLR